MRFLVEPLDHLFMALIFFFVAIIAKDREYVIVMK